MSDAFPPEWIKFILGLSAAWAAIHLFPVT